MPIELAPLFFLGIAAFAYLFNRSQMRLLVGRSDKSE